LLFYALGVFARNGDLYYSGLLANTEPYMFTIPSVTGGPTAATSYICAAINENGANKRNAYEFIKICLREDMQLNSISGGLLPVYTKVLDSKMDERLRITESINSAGFTFAALREEDTTRYRKLVTEVKFIQYNARVIDMIYDAMLPYFKGETIYDACLADLKNELDLLLR